MSGSTVAFRAQPYIWQCPLSGVCSSGSIAELLAQNALLERMSGVVQQHEIGPVIHLDIDL
jgi:hypothetical protein